ncbi:hypothetical protein BDFB_011928 [Asbolus verrucosus]|uniref:Uncharacterized protein n=1 Tax=Asbolus verrucosus TaxID=1661398 RepID=A0A482W1B4_ASBVE|nr:hypothetical protein BDFB_011928 [Asbolus verrucosus]
MDYPYDEIFKPLRVRYDADTNYVSEFIQTIERTTTRVHDHFNKKAAPSEFQVGDRVYLHDPADKAGISVTATIREIHGGREEKAHVNRLKPCFATDSMLDGLGNVPIKHRKQPKWGSLGYPPECQQRLSQHTTRRKYHRQYAIVIQTPSMNSPFLPPPCSLEQPPTTGSDPSSPIPADNDPTSPLTQPPARFQRTSQQSYNRKGQKRNQEVEGTREARDLLQTNPGFERVEYKFRVTINFCMF